MPPARTRGRPARRGDPRGAADPPGAQFRADQRRPVRRARGSVQPRPGDADGACGGPAGPAAAHHPGDQRPGRRGSGPTGPAPHRPATGRGVHHRGRPGRGAGDPASSQRVAGRPDQGVRPGRARGSGARRRPAAEGGRVSPTFHSFRYVNYRLWFTGAFVANIGTWMQRVAQDWLVLTVLSNDSGIAVGITTALQFVPALFLSAWAGLLADRVDRRKLLMATQVGMGVLAGALGLLVMSGSAQLWHVYVFAGLLGCVSAIDGPARQTFVADMVPADRLANAVGLNSASFNAARMIGPGLAGLLIAWVGTGWVFMINAVTFAATIVALARMRVDELQPVPHVPRGKGQIREAMRYVRRRSDIIVVMVVVGVVSTFGLNFQLTSAVMARTEFGKGPGEYGILGSVLAIGSLAGALLAAGRERPRVRLVVGSALAFGVASGVMALMPNYPLYALATIPVGFASLTMLTAANATIQMSTTPAMRGRVLALYIVVFLGATPKARAEPTTSRTLGRSRPAASSAPANEPIARTEPRMPYSPGPLPNSVRAITALVSWKFRPNVLTTPTTTITTMMSERRRT